MKKLVFLILFIFSTKLNSLAQQYNLYNSGTLYDAFENPSQKAFRADSSREYACNFIFPPVLSFNGSLNGPGIDFFKKSLFDRITDIKLLSLQNTTANELNLNANLYLLMLRIFADIQFHQEIGLSWQLRNDTYARVTNGVIILAQDNEQFKDGQRYFDLLDGDFSSQSYHQLSFTYRKNDLYNRRLGFGIKLSYLSGLKYDAAKLKNSFLSIKDLIVRIEGDMRYRSSLSYKKSDPDKDVNIWPSFVNPGFSFTLSANLKLRRGWYLMGNLKDVGFISWNKKSKEQTLNPTNIAVDANSIQGITISDFSLSDKETGFTSLTNAKIELLISKENDRYLGSGDYVPNLILSKNLFYPGGDITLVNNYHINNVVLSASVGYNPNTSLQIGGQFMVKNPNFEFHIGSDQPLKTYQLIKSLTSSKRPDSGYLGASLYLGLAIKFGRVLYHRANSPFIPGMK